MANLHDRQGDAAAVATGDVEPCEHHTTQSRRHVWHRVLYTRQHFPDNHVDRDTFMASLVPNREYIRDPLPSCACSNVGMRLSRAPSAPFVPPHAKKLVHRRLTSLRHGCGFRTCQYAHCPRWATR